LFHVTMINLINLVIVDINLIRFHKLRGLPIAFATMILLVNLISSVALVIFTDQLGLIDLINLICLIDYLGWST